MIEYFITYIQSIIFAYGAWGVFLATLIEEVIAPIPSPVVSLAAGFFLLPTSISLAEVVLRAAVVIALPVSIGISIGSALIYALGFFGGKPVIEKSKRWTGIKWHDVEKLEDRLTSGVGDEITLFILRLLPVVPGAAISGFCGIIRYPFKKFISITFIGAFLRAFILGVIGWQVGEVYTIYADVIAQFEQYILMAVVILFFLGFGGYYIVKNMYKSAG